MPVHIRFLDEDRQFKVDWTFFDSGKPDEPNERFQDSDGKSPNEVLFELVTTKDAEIDRINAEAEQAHHDKGMGYMP
jgi:hypothetical protein